MKGTAGRGWNSSARYHPRYAVADFQPLQQLLGIQTSQIYVLLSNHIFLALQIERNFLLMAMVTMVMMYTTCVTLQTAPPRL